MYSYPTLNEEDKKKAVEVAKDLIPDDAELVLLSFTGGRAFGWGGEHHDIDIHGMFAYDKEWFFKCHSNTRGFDMTLQNVYNSNSPELRWGRWKQYYDKSNPIYTHEDFDFEEDFIDQCKPEYVQNVFPYDLNLQFARCDINFNTRSSLHTYKEMMIPLYYLITGEIESDIVNVINEHQEFRYEELSKCAEKYKHRESSVDINDNKVREEHEELYHRLREKLEQETDFEPNEKTVKGPPMPSDRIPGNSEGE